MDQSHEANSNHGGTSPTSPPFDPLCTEKNHERHANSADIIVHEESGRTFCPQCLERKASREINKFSEDVYRQYVCSLFKSLDHFGSRKQIREIVLTTMQIILQQRSIQIESDQDFHNCLRIIYKVINSERFHFIEFHKVTHIFTSLCSSAKLHPLPLISVWGTCQKLIKFAELQLSIFPSDYRRDMSPASARFLVSCSLVVKTYLNLFRQFAFDQVSETIFPLSESEDSLTYNRNYYQDSQVTCLKFVTKTLFQRCWPPLAASESTLSSIEKDMIGDFFEALTECLHTAARIKYCDYFHSLKLHDPILTAHQLITQNPGRDFRIQVREFLRFFVLNQIEQDFLDLGNFANNLLLSSQIETNHEKAIALSVSADGYRSTLLYFYTNYAAIRVASSYFNRENLLRVIKSVDPEALNIEESLASTRVYIYLLANVAPRVGSYDNVDHFINRVWRNLKNNIDNRRFNEEFCFDDVVFFWAYKHPDFRKLVSLTTIKHILEVSVTLGHMEKNLSILLRNKHYKPLVEKFLGQEESAPIIVSELIRADCQSNQDFSPNHFELISQMSAILPALTQAELLRILGRTYDSADKLIRLVSMLVLLMRNCKHFDLILDNQFIDDLFKLMENLYNTCQLGAHDELLIVLNEFLVSIMLTSNPAIMRVLKSLEFSIMGIMSYRLSQYKAEDRLSESIAKVLVTYDGLDYPLRNDIVKGLRHLASNSISWMSSHNEDLHNLSMIVAEKALRTEEDTTARIRITTGIIHLLVSRPDVVENPIQSRALLSLVKHDEFLYNPLSSRVLDILPEEVLHAFEKHKTEARIPSPVLSFESADSSNDGPGDGDIDITSILCQLNDRAGTRNNQSDPKIPPDSFLSDTVNDQHVNVADQIEWERTAHQTNIVEV